MESMLTDLLTNMFHLARQEMEDIGALILRSIMHFNDETKGRNIEMEDITCCRSVD